MPISKKLRLAYVAEWLLAIPVSAVPVEHSPVVAEGDRSMAMMYEKREDNHGPPRGVLGDPVRLDHELKSQGGNGDGDSESDGDSVKSTDSSHKSSVS